MGRLAQLVLMAVGGAGVTGIGAWLTLELIRMGSLWPDSAIAAVLTVAIGIFALLRMSILNQRRVIEATVLRANQTAAFVRIARWERLSWVVLALGAGLACCLFVLST